MKLIHKRALDLMMINQSGGSWGLQAPGARWRTVGYRMGEHQIRRHIEGAQWVGCRRPRGSLTDRIILDLDCKEPTPENIAAQKELFDQIRWLFGLDRIPFVWSTPSGRGLRIVYRIPEMALADLREGDEVGLVADVLRGAGITVGLRGEVEIFPAHNRLDRQPFGRSSSVLDPDTLEPRIMVEAGRPLTDEELTLAVEWKEHWYAQVDPDLMSHLRALPTKKKDSGGAPQTLYPRERRNLGARVGVAEVDAERPNRDESGESPLVIGLHGLQRHGTRYFWEFRMGARIWAWPNAFGLQSGPSREEVASRLVEWLAEHHNGFSKEWKATLGSDGESATEAWQKRYLRRGPDGRAPVDRMRDAGRSLRSMQPASPCVSRSEYRAIHRVATRSMGSLESRPDRYRFEVWASGAIGVAKRQVLRGGLSGDIETLTAQIKAEWLKEIPFGSNFQRYRKLLEHHELLTAIAGHVWAPDPTASNVATIYRLGEIPDAHSERWVGPDNQGVPPGVLGKRLLGETVYGRQVTSIEAYHAIDACARGRSLPRIYGRGAASTIERIHRAAIRRSVLV